MHQPTRSVAGQEAGRPSRRAFDLLLVVIVLAAYSLTLGVANDLTVASAVAGGAANTVPFVLFGAASRRLIIDHLVGRPPARQFAGHAVLGIGYALLAYWLVTVLLGLINGTSPTAFVVRPFPERAMAWQLLENATTYGFIAALSHLQAHSEPKALDPVQRLVDQERRDPEPSRFFIRSGEDLRPIDFDRIVSIIGADDYAEVATLDGRHLVRMTLAEFEKALDPARFVRVHRSRIVNLDHVVRAEPAGGGRMLLHMEDGETIAASRAGSRLLRERTL